MEVESQREDIREQTCLCKLSLHVGQMGHAGDDYSGDIGQRIRSWDVCRVGGSGQFGSACPSSQLTDIIHHTVIDLDWLQQRDFKYQGQPASDPLGFYTAEDVCEWSQKLGTTVSKVVARFEDPEDGHDPLLLFTTSGEYYMLLDFLFYPLGHDIATVEGALTDIKHNGLEKRAFLDPYHWRDICQTNTAILRDLESRLCK